MDVSRVVIVVEEHPETGRTPSREQVLAHCQDILADYTKSDSYEVGWRVVAVRDELPE